MSTTLKGTLITLIAGIAWGLIRSQRAIFNGSRIFGYWLNKIFVYFFLALSLLFFPALQIRRSFWPLSKINLPTFRSLNFAFFRIVIDSANLFRGDCRIQCWDSHCVTVSLSSGYFGLYLCQDRVAPTLAEVVSMLLAIGGTFLIATHGQVNHLAINPKGLAWGVVSAFAYALYIILPLKLIQKWGSMLVIGVGMAIPGILMLPFSGLLSSSGNYRLDTWMALFGLVVIGTIFAYTAFLKGTSLVGAVKGSLLASFEPISAVFFAFVIMKEHFFIIDFLGMGMILLAVLLITLKDFIIQKEKGIL